VPALTATELHHARPDPGELPGGKWSDRIPRRERPG